jgi:hypothetical protein
MSRSGPSKSVHTSALRVQNSTDNARWACENCGAMPHKNDKNRPDKKGALARLKSEMAMPRMSKSATIAQRNFDIARLPEPPKVQVSGTVEKIIPEQNLSEPEKADISIEQVKLPNQSLLIENTLKLPLILSLCVIAVAPIAGQEAAITIALTKTSGTPVAYLVENFPKSGCPNISIISDESKADYVLDAHGGDFEGPNGSEGPHGPRPPHPKARYTLSRNGTVVFGTTPIKEKNAVKDVCKFFLKGSSK